MEKNSSFYLALGLLAGLWVIGMFDVFAIFSGGKTRSVSETVWEWSKEWPTIAFLAGFVCGHLFFRG